MKNERFMGGGINNTEVNMIRNTTRRLSGVYAGLIAVLITLAVHPVPAFADKEEDVTTLYLNMTSDDPGAARTAFQTAQSVLKNGHSVAVFLNGCALRLADKNSAETADTVSADPPVDMLEDLIDAGATVYVCSGCTETAGMTEADWINGMKVGSAETIKVRAAPGTKIMFY